MIPIQKLGIDWPSIDTVVIEPSHATSIDHAKTQEGWRAEVRATWQKRQFNRSRQSLRAISIAG